MKPYIEKYVQLILKSNSNIEEIGELVDKIYEDGFVDGFEDGFEDGCNEGTKNNE